MKHSKAIDTRYVGDDFDSFLAEDGIAQDVEARAIKKLMVALLQSTGLTQVELALRMQTSRTQVRRLLDPDNTSVTLTTMQRTAAVMGHRLVIGFESLDDKMHVQAVKRSNPKREMATAG